jgi:ribulose-5-phosphate 4-epimerase/fuculose-1-phosphate aldolase
MLDNSDAIGVPSQPAEAPAEERQLQEKQRLAASFRIFARRGFDEGAAGHITVRDPVAPDTFWVNPFGLHFSKIRVSDLIRVDHAGEIVEGQGFLNQAAFAIHSRIHAARPDVHAAAHSHSMFGKTWSSLGRLLDPISQDSCAFYEDHALFDDFNGVVLDPAEGDRIGDALGKKKAIILQNHGLLTVGGHVGSAVFWYLLLERSCESQLMAEAAGTPRLIRPEAARLTCEQIGSETAGIFSFEGLYQQLAVEEPDLLD